jgi:monolysocardiolipin acyltransferase
MRYFKWGVSRLILEPEVAPVVVPMFITGLEQVMAEDRGWPRFIPRVGKKVEIVYGDAVPTERWEDVRAAWQALRGEEGEEAAKLRIETTRRVREEVVNLRRRLGFPDEEPGADDPATYRLPGMDAKDGKLKDGSMVKDT